MKAVDDKEKDVKAAAKQTKDDLVTQFNEIIDGAERLLKESADQADEKTSELRERLSSTVSDMRDTMEQHAKPICQKGKEALKVTDNYVKSNPWVSVGVAAAAAVVISQLFRRR